MRSVALLVLLSALLSCAEPRPPGVLEMSTAQLRLEPSAITTVPLAPPPPDEGEWVSSTLPDSWRVARRRIYRDGWYRATFALGALPDEPWSIYLPRISMNGAIYLNGGLLGTGGRFGEPLAQRWNDPLRLDVPPGLLRTGQNVVHVLLRTNPSSLGVLFPILAGPTEELRPLENSRRFRQVNASRVLSALLLAGGGLLLVVYLRAGETPITLWFALGSILFGVNAAGFWVRDVPMGTRAWQWLMAVSLWASVLCFLRAANLWIGRRGGLVERLSPFAAAGIAIALAVTSDVDAGMVVGLSATLISALLVYLGVVLLRAGLAGRGTSRRWAILPGAALLLMVAHDAAMLFLPLSVFETFLYPYAVPLGLLLVGAAAVSRYAGALREAATLNRELEQRVADKSAELEKNYRRVADLEAERAVAAERERLMQEMHDGIGGQIVSTLAMVQSRRFTPDGIEEALTDALDDLRMMIESLDPMEGDLGALLGAVRARLERRLERHGLRFDWQVRPVPPIPQFGPAHAGHVLRILQEAITNVVRHAGARTITVSTGTTTDGDGRDATVFLTIADDGRGFDTTSTPGGRGLANMRRRADAVGARLEIASTGSRTELRLSLPM